MTARVEISLWAVTLALSAAAIHVALRPRQAVPVERGQPVHPRAAARDAGAVRRQASKVIAADPFRIDREPARVAFDPTPRAPAEVVTRAAAAPKPTLTLRAVVGGPPWEALLDGIPGRSGSARVRAGDRIGGLIVVAINKDVVILQGMDTTWRLGVIRTWQ